MDILGDALIVSVWLVWSGEESSTWLDHLIVLLLLSLIMENSTTVDDANWGKFRVFSNHLLIIVRRSVRSSREDTLRSSTGLCHLTLSRSDDIWHDNWALILLAD